MNNPLATLFEIDDFKPPYHYKGDFKQHLTELLKKFVTELKSRKDEILKSTVEISPSALDKTIASVEHLSSQIIRTLNYYYDGDLKEAIESIHKVMDKKLLSDISPSSFETGTAFYRVRKKRSAAGLKAKELLHIPFEQRGKVLTQRFSIPGYPSLYLGNSIYTCWEELHRCQLDEIHAIKYVNLRAIKYVDLTVNRFLDVSWYVKNNKEKYRGDMAFLMKSVRTWPLIVACSIKVQKPMDNFKPEYIFPQLLLQFVKKAKDISAIKYTSTHVTLRSVNDDFANIVMPVKSRNDEGYCSEICNAFNYSKPYSYELHNIESGEVYQYDSSELEFMNPSFSEVEIHTGRNVLYGNTKLGRFELNLKHQNSLHSYIEVINEDI